MYLMHTYILLIWTQQLISKLLIRNFYDFLTNQIVLDEKMVTKKQAKQRSRCLGIEQNYT